MRAVYGGPCPPGWKGQAPLVMSANQGPGP